MEAGFFGVLVLDLLEGEAFEVAEGAFAEGRFELDLVGLVDGCGEEFAGVVGAAEVGGVDGVEGEVFGGEALAEGFRLVATVFGEGGVGVALPESGAVPFGFAVADEVEFGHGGDACGWSGGDKGKLCVAVDSEGGWW